MLIEAAKEECGECQRTIKEMVERMPNSVRVYRGPPHRYVPFDQLFDIFIHQRAHRQIVHPRILSSTGGLYNYNTLNVNIIQRIKLKHTQTQKTRLPESGCPGSRYEGQEINIVIFHEESLPLISGPGPATTAENQDDC